MLTNLGAKSVLEAPDGLAALEAIRTADPDVMLLDWDMPVLNGIEVLRIVRSPGCLSATELAGHHPCHTRAPAPIEGCIGCIQNWGVEAQPPYLASQPSVGWA